MSSYTAVTIDAPADGQTFPARAYTEESFLALERERIFRRAWQYAGPRDWISSPGDYFTLTVGGIPVIVLRDMEGEVRAFANVCRHRGSEVVQGAGNRKTLQCPYHAWTYGLDGSLVAAPRSDREECFDRSAFRLQPFRVEVWGPLVFVNPNEKVSPLAETLGELPAIIERTGIRFDELKFRERCEYEFETNWKVAVENTLECYHCPVAHPSFADLIDLDDYHLEEFEYFSVQGGPVRMSALDDGSAAYDAHGDVDVGLYCFLWPNLMVNVNPGPGNFHTNWTLPVSAGRTKMINDFFFVDSVGGEEAKDYVAFEDRVMWEDIALVESVQRGLSSGALDHGNLLLASEHALQHFQQLVYRSLVDADGTGG